MKYTDPSRSRIRRALTLLRKNGTERNGAVFSASAMSAGAAYELLRILNPMPRPRKR